MTAAESTGTPGGVGAGPDRRLALRAILEEHPQAGELTERRKGRIVDVALRRLTSVTVVMENLFDSHNVSAVVRTAEGFGLDAVHVVEQPNPYVRNKHVLRGADRWLSVVRHRGLNACASSLLAQGFVLCAADVEGGAVPVDEVPVDRPVAVVMGSENRGLSRAARALAEVRFSIPMAGFTESFNVSVSAALALFDLTRRRRRFLGAEGDLSFDEVTRRAVAWLELAAKRRSRPA